MDAAKAQRSSRQRKASKAARTFDQNQRNELKRKRLEALERDNWQEEKERPEDEEDDDYVPLDDSDDDGAPPHTRARAQSTTLLTAPAVPVAVDVGGRSTKKKKRKKKSDVWNAAQKCKSLQVAGPSLTPPNTRYHPAWRAAPPPPPTRRWPARAGDLGRGRIPQVPKLGAQLRLHRCCPLALPAAPLLLRHRPRGQVQVPDHRGLPRDAGCLQHAPGDETQGPGLMRYIVLTAV